MSRSTEVSPWDQKQGAERPPSRTGAATAQTAVTLPTVTEHLAEAAERVPSRAVAGAGPLAAEAAPSNVAEHLSKVEERLPSRAVGRAGSSTAAVAPPNVAEPMTTKRARQFHNKNENVIGCGASFFRNLLLN